MLTDSKIVDFFQFGSMVQKSRIFNILFLWRNSHFNIESLLNRRIKFKNPTILESAHMQPEIYDFLLIT